jgi:hypothetical protein
MRKVGIWVLLCGVFWGGISFVEATPRLAQLGRAYQFDGVDDIVVFDKTDIDFSEATYIDFEVDMSKQSGEFTSIGQVMDGSNRVEMSWYTNDRVYFVLANGSNTLGNVSVTDFGKHTFRFLFDGSGATNADRCKIFVDGIEKTLSFSGTIPSSLPILTSDFKFGYSASGYSNGKIGNVKQYDENGKLLHSWHGDEGGGVRSFDAVQEWYGEELATNGTFDSNVSGFTTSRCDLTWNPNGYATVTGTDASNFAILQSGVQVIGKRYRFSFWAKSDDITDPASMISAHYDELKVVKQPNLSSQWQEYIFEGIAKTIFVIYPSGSASSTGQSVDVDNISIKEIYSPAHGTITNANEVTFHAEDRDFASYQNTLGYAEEVPQEELLDISVSPSAHSSTTSYSNGIRRITGTNAAVTGVLRWNGLIPNPLDLRNYKVSYDARSNAETKIYPDIVDDWISRPLVTSDFQNFSYEIAAQNLNPGLEFIDWNVEKVGGGNLLATDYGEIQNVSIREVSLPGQLIPRAIDEDGNALLTDIFGNYMDGSRRSAMSQSDLYLDTPVAVFDGVDDYVQFLGSGNKLKMSATDKIEIEFDIIRGDKLVNQVILGQDYTKGFYINTSSTENISFYTAGDFLNVSGGIPMGESHNVKCIYNNGIKQIYVDDVLAASGTGTILEDTNNLYVGRGATVSNFYKGGLSGLKISINDKLVLQSNFSEGGGDTVYDKVPEYYGENIVVNGNFNTDSIWGKGTGWTISGGKSMATEVQSYATINQTAPVNFFKVGGTYRVTLNVSTLNSGKFGLYLAGSGMPNQAENNISTSGTHVFIKTLDTVISQSFAIRGYPDVDGSIESISIEELHEPAHGTITNADLSTFWTNDDTSRSDNLLDGFSKGLYCSAAGRAYIENKEAYGKVFDAIIQGNISTANYIPFIANNTTAPFSFNGYYLALLSDNSIHFYRRTGDGALSLFKTAIGYLDFSTPHRLLIFRNQTTNQYVTGGVGTFAVYVQGNTVPITGDVFSTPDTTKLELLTVSAGSNPVLNNDHTTSNYSVLDVDGSVKIINYFINDRRINMDSFFIETGTFENINIPAQDGNTGKDVFKNLLAQPTTVNSVVNRLRLSALNLVTVGRRYWDTSYKKFFLGDTNSSFVEFPASDYVVPQTTLNTLSTNKTAVPGRLYYDTTERAFKKGASDGSVIDY